MGTHRDVATLGQVFTPPHVVDLMLSLRRNRGRTLEPACGDGAFSDRLMAEGTETVALELDPGHAPAYARVMDFFDLPLDERFATVVGNPPYVGFRHVHPDTAAKLDTAFFNARSNLYLFFIKRAVELLGDGGELIFIVPRDFVKLSSAAALNRWLYERGTFTDAIETGDTSLFGQATPNCLIFRYEKGDLSRRCRFSFLGREPKDVEFRCVNGQLLFQESGYDVPLATLFSVRVGGVSGAQHLFAAEDGNVEVVCSTTAVDGKTRRMLWGEPARERLLPHKEELLARRIRRFDESNWWHWGRGFGPAEGPRVYVNNFTRHADPFFLHPCRLWDNSVFALFPHDPGMDLERAVGMLNAVDWHELGFVIDGRLLFAQRSLEGCLLPSCFRELLGQGTGTGPGEPVPSR